MGEKAFGGRYVRGSFGRLAILVAFGFLMTGIFGAILRFLGPALLGGGLLQLLGSGFRVVCIFLGIVCVCAF